MLGVLLVPAVSMGLVMKIRRGAFAPALVRPVYDFFIKPLPQSVPLSPIFDEQLTTPTECAEHHLSGLNRFKSL